MYNLIETIRAEIRAAMAEGKSIAPAAAPVAPVAPVATAKKKAGRPRKAAAPVAPAPATPAAPVAPVAPVAVAVQQGAPVQVQQDASYLLRKVRQYGIAFADGSGIVCATWLPLLDTVDTATGKKVDSGKRIAVPGSDRPVKVTLRNLFAAQQGAPLIADPLTGKYRCDRFDAAVAFLLLTGQVRKARSGALVIGGSAVAPSKSATVVDASKL